MAHQSFRGEPIQGGGQSTCAQEVARAFPRARRARARSCAPHGTTLPARRHRPRLPLAFRDARSGLTTPRATHRGGLWIHADAAAHPRAGRRTHRGRVRPPGHDFRHERMRRTRRRARRRRRCSSQLEWLRGWCGRTASRSTKLPGLRGGRRHRHAGAARRGGRARRLPRHGRQGPDAALLGAHQLYNIFKPGGDS